MPSPPDPAEAGVFPPGLLVGLIDDAAVFPPGNAPLAVALAEHVEHRSAAYAALVGPLLLPAGVIASARAILDEGRAGEPIEIGVIGRPGADVDQVRAAAAVAAETDRMTLRGIEIGWQPDWRELDLDAPALVLEIPRGADRDAALDDIAAGDPGRPGRVLGKFRTGPTPSWPWPDEDELAAVLTDAARRDLPLKLTGGLHHAVRTTIAGPEPTDAEHDGGEHHGVLNVLLAAHLAQHGASVTDVAGILAFREAEPLIARLTSLGKREVRRTRGLVTAYGCCTVTDPVAELDALGLLEGSPS